MSPGHLRVAIDVGEGKPSVDVLVGTTGLGGELHPAARVEVGGRATVLVRRADLVGRRFLSALERALPVVVRPVDLELGHRPLARRRDRVVAEVAPGDEHRQASVTVRVLRRVGVALELVLHARDRTAGDVDLHHALLTCGQVRGERDGDAVTGRSRVGPVPVERLVGRGALADDPVADVGLLSSVVERRGVGHAGRRVHDHVVADRAALHHQEFPVVAGPVSAVRVERDRLAAAGDRAVARVPGVAVADGVVVRTVVLPVGGLVGRRRPRQQFADDADEGLVDFRLRGDPEGGRRPGRLLFRGLLRGVLGGALFGGFDDLLRDHLLGDDLFGDGRLLGGQLVRVRGERGEDQCGYQQCRQADLNPLLD